MELSQIIKMFMDIDEPQIKIDKKIYKAQENAMLKCEDALRSAFKDDKTLDALYYELDDAFWSYYTVMISQYFKEGFVYGAKIALEISGWDNNSAKDFLPLQQ